MRSPGAGRRPKPSAVRIAEGMLGHRPLNKNEPKPGGLPTCPKHLDAVAKKEWRRISDELNAIGVLTSVDRAVLAAYAVTWSRWVAAEEALGKFGLVIKSAKSGLPMANPYVAIANNALSLMKSFLVEMGCTPSSRARISVAGKEPTDSFSDFMASLGATEEIGVEAPCLGRKDEVQ